MVAIYHKSWKSINVYNREKYKVVKTDNGNKKLLKLLGFTWDKFNHSYILKDVPFETLLHAIETLKPHMTIEEHDNN